MKAVAELPVIGIIGTFTIVLAVVMPSLVIQSSLYKDIDYTYDFQTQQNSLMALTSSTLDRQNQKQDAYESIGLNYVNNNPQDSRLKASLETTVGNDYCVSIRPDGSPESTVLISPTPRNACPPYDTQFNTIFVLPYNKDKPLVQVLQLGAK